MPANLQSGTVTLDQTLATIAAPSGLSAGVSISYSSHVAKEVATWNREAPSDSCGLGWKQDRTYILRQPLHSGFEDSDGYALISGGTLTHKLILLQRTNTEKGLVRLYGCEPHEAWVIERLTTVDIGDFLSSETFTITTEDGTVSTFGGTVSRDTKGQYSSENNTIEWEVTWDGWSGPCRLVWIDPAKTKRAQIQEPVVWNLKSRHDVHGWSLWYKYTLHNIPVGDVDGLCFTRWAELTEICQAPGQPGQRILLGYGGKDARELPPQRLEGSLGSPFTLYQDRFCLTVLGSVTVFNDTPWSSDLVQTVLLDFSGNPAGGVTQFLNHDWPTMVKRLLRGITVKGPNDVLLAPPTRFDYFGQDGQWGTQFNVTPNSAVVYDEI